MISAVEIFALIFAFYEVVALGGQYAMLGVALVVAALVVVFGFVLTVIARKPEPPFEFQSVGCSSFQIDVDELRSRSLIVSIKGRLASPEPAQADSHPQPPRCWQPAQDGTIRQ